MTDNNNEVFFKIKKSTKLEKLMGAFCERQGKTVSSVRFLFEGQRVQPNDTPDTVSGPSPPPPPPLASSLLLPAAASNLRWWARLSRIVAFTHRTLLTCGPPPSQLEMQDGDTLEVHQEQVGGSGLF